MHRCRTVLEQKIRERRETYEEFAEYAERFAREHNEPGTLSVRHVQRLAAGEGTGGQRLGTLRPATRRLLERIFELDIAQLLKVPRENASMVQPGAQLQQGPKADHRPGMSTDPRFRTVPRDQAATSRRSAWFDETPPDADDRARRLASSFDWLDKQAGWIPDTSRREVLSRLSTLNARELRHRERCRRKVGRSDVAAALSKYYGQGAFGHATYGAEIDGRTLETSILTRPEWLGVSCPLSSSNERLSLASAKAEGGASHPVDSTHALHRLAEAAALGVRVADVPLYRLSSIDVTPEEITGTVGLVPFVEYALTMDLLEAELLDALCCSVPTSHDALPLRNSYLPNLRSVVDINSRLCVGGALAVCAIARPPDEEGGMRDYALLVQERSGSVLNAPSRLAVVPKGFHQPLKEPRSDAKISATLRRELEEELLGRGELDSTVEGRRVAAPMHPKRLSEPMRWLTSDPGRMKMECTGFGFNLVSGNYEIASLIVIDDERFWSRYGDQLEANWEAAGLHLYSSLDRDLLTELAQDESWTNEGVFAFLHGLRRLRDFDASRVNAPDIRCKPSST